GHALFTRTSALRRVSAFDQWRSIAKERHGTVQVNCLGSYLCNLRMLLFPGPLLHIRHSINFFLEIGEALDPTQSATTVIVSHGLAAALPGQGSNGSGHVSPWLWTTL